MNLYLISQDRVSGYDTYDSAVVAAKSIDDARLIHPAWDVTHHNGTQWMGTSVAGVEYKNNTDTWVDFEEIYLIDVEFLGKTKHERGVVLASFNAG